MSKARCVASKDVTTCINSPQRCLEDVTDVRRLRVALRHGTWERGRLVRVLMIGILLRARAGGTPAVPGG